MLNGFVSTFKCYCEGNGLFVCEKILQTISIVSKVIIMVSLVREVCMCEGLTRDTVDWKYFIAKKFLWLTKPTKIYYMKSF